MPTTPRLSTVRAALAFFVIAVVMTWPLARHLTSRLPADLGDPAFNSWVMMWTGGQILSALHGAAANLRQLDNAIADAEKYQEADEASEKKPAANVDEAHAAQEFVLR